MRLRSILSIVLASAALVAAGHSDCAFAEEEGAGVVPPPFALVSQSKLYERMSSG